MKRRSFLTMLGLAPLAPLAAAGAVAAEPLAAIDANVGLCVQASSLRGDTVIEFKDGVLKLHAAYVKDIERATAQASAVVQRIDAYPAGLAEQINASTDALLERFQGVSG